MIKINFRPRPARGLVRALMPLLTLAVLFGILLSLTNCAPALVMASLAPEAEEAHQKREMARIMRRANPCNSLAVSNETDEVICEVGDCACHARIASEAWSKLNRGKGYPR